MATIKSPRVNKALIVGSIITLLVFVFCISWYSSNLPPDVVLPPLRKMPSPNASDYYLLAYKKIHSEVRSATYHGETVGPAWTIMEKSKELLAKKETAIAVTGDSIELIHEGFRYQYQSHIKHSFFSISPIYYQYIDLALYLRLRAEVLSAHGNWDGAIESNLDSLRMGNDLLKDGPLDSTLSGIDIQTIGRSEIWQSIDHLDAKEACIATQRMEQIVNGQLPLSNCLQGEKIFIQQTLLELFKQQDWRKELEKITDGPFGFFGSDPPDIIRPMLESVKMMTFNKRHIFNDYTSHMNLQITEARKTYRLSKPIPSNSSITYSLTPVFEHIKEIVVVNEVENTLLLTSLALFAYKAEHGTYPASLNALTPKYLKMIPDDPFAISSPLCYKPTNTKYMLYSIGPDGKDDGGKAIDSGQTNSSIRYHIFPYRKGDIVAGVNLF